MSTNSFKEKTVFLSLLFSFYLLHAHCTIRDVKYTPAPQCSAMVLAPSFRFRTVGARNLLRCLATCRIDSQCVSVVYESSERSCHLGSNPAAQDCSNMVAAADSSVKFFQQTIICQNGGIVVTKNNTCACSDPYHGEHCEGVYRDCKDVKDAQTNGYLALGSRVIFPLSAPAPFPVLCFPKWGRTYLIFRRFGDVTFNRTWQEYVDGFGSVDVRDHWLGLEKLHHVTNNAKTFELKFEVHAPNGTKEYAKYNTFKLQSAADGYTFTTTFTANSILFDCLTPLQGVPFSTRDNDSDGSASDNCALETGAGWWFKPTAGGAGGCFPACNPLGAWNPTSSAMFEWAGDLSQAFWNRKTGGAMLLSRVEGYLLV